MLRTIAKPTAFLITSITGIQFEKLCTTIILWDLTSGIQGGRKQQSDGKLCQQLARFTKSLQMGTKKLSHQALKMGDIGLPIYAFKDKWTDNLLFIRTVPNSRLAGAVGHLFLDFIKEIGGIPLQMDTDKGPETGYIYAIQVALREVFAPEIDPDIYPEHVFLKSVHNTVIEGFWRWLREKAGVNIKEHILRGKHEHIFDASVPFHHDLFNWIFPPLVQAELDEFRTWWNQHRVRFQPDKNMPSGHVPIDVLEHPELHGGLDCRIQVPDIAIEDLREYLTEEVGSRGSTLDWVTDEFSVFAKEVHGIIGAPKITFTNSWIIFAKMSAIMETYT